MKKLNVIALVLSLCFVLVSCKGDTGPQGAAGDPSNGMMSISFQQGAQPYTSYAGCTDTYISSNSPTTNYNTNTNILAGQSSLSKYRTLIKFNITALVPSNAVVKAAYLSLNNSFCSPSIQPIAAYKVTQFWDTLVTWNTYNGSNSWTTVGGDYSATPVSNIVSIGGNSSDVVLKLDNAMVQDWLTNSLTNYGVIIIGQNENTTSYGVYYNNSSDATNVDVYPRLTIYYTLP